MRLHQRAVAAVFVTTVALIALAPHAVAAPMTWETSKSPTHHVVSSAASSSGTVTVLCGNPCYQ
ncbi:hypothetical protein ACIRJO_31950 [Streptomyces sp. NPDC102394]|uniref:hypothetical protein n=1 Tax=Streptomyces sp. NPDC102394 TaxID=3366167 RepID=UPI0037F86AEE